MNSRGMMGRGVARAALVAGLMAGVAVAGLSGPVLAQNFQFSNVAIDGNVRVDDATILSYAGIPRGTTVSAGQLNDAYQRIVDSGLFEEVQLVPNGNRLSIEVREYPTINRISIEGNRRLDDEDLLPLVQSSPRRVYSPVQAEADAATLAEAYAAQGRLAATIEPRIIRRTDNRVDLVFEVVEGRVVEVERISFVGNRSFSERRLRDVLGTSQAGFLRRFVRSDTFVEERIAFDRQVLTDFYASRGFIDFQVLSVSSELTRQRDGVLLTFNVREGQKFKFGDVTANSTLPDVDVDTYRAALGLKGGEVYSPALIERTIARLERLAIEQELNFVRVSPNVTRNDADGTLDVDFVLERGPRIFVERIDIEGNATTLDRVIRREFTAVEGDPFNPRQIRQSAERIRALGFFSQADVSTRPGSTEDQVIVDVNVEEQPTGSLSFGGTYSATDGLGLSISLSERNFLGRGQYLSLSYSGGVDNRNAAFSFAEPGLLDRDLRLTFDASYFTTNNANASYDTETTDVRLGLEFPLAETSRLGVFAGLGQARIFDVSTNSPIILKEAGDRKTHSIGYTYSYDTRGVGVDPNTGILLRFGQEASGLGTANTLVKTTALARTQTSVMNEDVKLTFDLEGGMINGVSGGTTRVTDRFFPSTAVFRGWQGNGIGPRDLGATGNDALGGNYFAVARLESQFPLGLPDDYNITGGLFMDVGSVWGLSDTAGIGAVDDSARLRATLGFAIYWTTGLGPLRFNFTTPLVKEAYDKPTSFDLTISTQF